MKKKLNPREAREQAKAAQQAAFKKAQEEKQKEIDRKKAEEEAAAAAKKAQEDRKRFEARAAEVVKNEPGQGKIKKSSAKAAGLKSTFVLSGNELLMTSFGRGNKAILEKSFISDQITPIATPENISVVSNDKRFTVDGRVKGGIADNPLCMAEKKPGEDMIHCRSALEKRFFGEEYADNIHVQIAYNILDIEKILSVHINNIIYALNNMLRLEGPEYGDLVGNLSIGKSYENFKTDKLYSSFLQLCMQKQLGYFGIEITDPYDDSTPSKAPRKEKPGSKHEEVLVSKEQFYYILCLLGSLRQYLAHGEAVNARYLYSLDSFSSDAVRGARDILDKLYADRIRKLNDDFVKTSEVDLNLLMRAFDVTDPGRKKKYVQDYYDFVVRKSYKNQGFSIKTLREEIEAGVEEARIIKDKQYDSVRQKINRFFDFATFMHYREKPAEAEELVGKLRAASSDFDKAVIYAAEAQRVWSDLRDVVMEHILKHVSGDEIKTLKENFKKDIRDTDIRPEMLEGVQISEKGNYFSKYMYLLTLFLDGKEINDLVTTLINKFENIDSFICVLTEKDLTVRFTGDYKLFSQSNVIACELRAINSFARMSAESGAAKEIMFVEACKVLGYRASEEDLIASIKAILEKATGKNGIKDTSFRNFIANNVIESNRFKYLIRYANPAHLSELAKNRAVIAFVLRQSVKDDQITRYYNACNGTNLPYSESMRGDLCERICNVSYDAFLNVKQKARDDTPEGEEKQKYVAIIRLYLTVLYLLVKNLVYVNSRYFLAFHCVERDSVLSGVMLGGKYDKDYRLLTEDFMKKYSGRKRVNEYMRVNLDHSDAYIIRAYRNAIEHVGAVRNAHLYLPDVKAFDSYFEIYHYLLQRTLIDQLKHDETTLSKREGEGFGKPIITRDAVNPIVLKYLGMVGQYHGYCKDFVKALNVPFGYNLARFKNLSIDGLFDKNDTREKPKGAKTTSVKPDEE